LVCVVVLRVVWIEAARPSFHHPLHWRGRLKKFRRFSAAMFKVLWVAAFAVPLANAAAASSSVHSQLQSVSHSDRHHHHRFMQAVKDAVKSADPEEDDSDDKEDDDTETVEVAAPEVSKVDKMKQKLEELNTLEVKLEDRLEYLENEHYEQKNSHGAEACRQ